MLSARRPTRAVRGLGRAFLYLSIYLYIYPEQTATSAAGPSTPSPSGRAPVPYDLVRRAELLGVSRSLWFDISQRPVGDIAAYLDAAEQPDDLGASSSAG